MKNKIKMGLALLMFATVIPNTAFAQDSSNQVPSEQVEFADIYIGDELIYMGLEHRRLELCVLVLQKITGDMSR